MAKKCDDYDKEEIKEAKDKARAEANTKIDNTIADYIKKYNESK